MIDEDAVRRVIDVLTGEVSEMPKNWNRRFKYNREKIKTGDVFELAEVVRNLAIREWEKGLSTGEKQMYTRAKKILASEFMYALDKDEDGAEEYIDGLLEERFGATRHRLSGSHHAAAIIAAAGSGERLGAGGPKALVELAGEPLVAWSLEAMRAAEAVTVVVIAAPPGHEAEVERIAGAIAGRPDEAGGFHPIVITGGRTRAESVGLALAEVPEQAPAVVVHDAARPLVTPTLIDALVERLAAAEGVAGVIAAAPVPDTLKRVGDAGAITATEPRERSVGGADAAGLRRRDPAPRARR